MEPGKLDIFFSINIQEQSEKHSQTESNFISVDNFKIRMGFGQKILETEM